ncbi:GNAT family N-acetyltransferase [Solitalea sp. MAHUQ-68]|uniref:GNAT family N-acetyltransferase n=1 Tax=Solitalea agri TaxID=2953739 RepID=A0A9X2F6X4_9SPHI|nr:GNAT family N-acetyltransferase [Solitalea agri]MCO4292968.1 GNAT family N-acetyltransferase [Solitalea agri]
MNSTPIQTPRLVLRPILPEDESALFELDSNPEVHRYLGNKPVKAIDEIQEVIKMIHQQYKENGIGRWAVIEKESGNFMGWAGLKLVKEPVNNQINYYDLGYRFIPDYWNKGYATEAALAWVDYAFEQLNLDELIGVADVDNLGSRKVLEKVGLKHVETFDYHGAEQVWLKITRQDWEQLKRKAYIH